MTEENQIVNPPTPENSDRNPDGTFATGNKIGITGGDNGQKGWQLYRVRVKRLMDKYTADEIRALIDDPKAFGRLSSYDAMAIKHIARALDEELTRTKLGGDDMRGERKDLLDRIEGQPTAKFAGDPELPAIGVKVTLSLGENADRIHEA